MAFLGTGADLRWSKPTVLRIEGDSAWMLKGAWETGLAVTVAVEGRSIAPVDSIERAEKKLVGGRGCCGVVDWC